MTAQQWKREYMREYMRKRRQSVAYRIRECAQYQARKGKANGQVSACDERRAH